MSNALATIERALHDQRIRHAIGTRMRAEPGLQQLATGGGPAMLSPMGMNGMRS